MKVIEVNKLRKEYRTTLAVNEISFSVEEGIIFGMLGPNGAGKSTTIECIIGLNKKDSGEVKVLGLDPYKDNKKLYDLIGVQLQETSYQDKIKVWELCNLFSAMYEEPLDYVPLLARFGLSDKRKSYISDLSGGQRQKIAIILALISNPKLIFLDELTTGLDPKARREMWEYIKELRDEGRTIFMTTHYMEEAEYLCDKICIIDEGEIVTIDDLDGVISKANIDNVINFKVDQDVTELLSDNIKDITNIERKDNEISIYSQREDVLTDLVTFLKENKVTYKNINIKRPSLEDAYLKLTGKRWEDGLQ